MSNWTKGKIQNSPLTARATIEGQEKVIEALRAELQAGKAGMNKIKADAIREASEHIHLLTYGESYDYVQEHANQVEQGQ